jgi:hypothetical protein
MSCIIKSKSAAITCICLGILLITSDVKSQSKEAISSALDLIDLKFEHHEIDSMRTDLQDQKNSYRSIRNNTISNDVPYSLLFVPPLNMERIPEE